MCNNASVESYVFGSPGSGSVIFFSSDKDHAPDPEPSTNELKIDKNLGSPT
jgi:hypothetical protein